MTPRKLRKIYAGILAVLVYVVFVFFHSYQASHPSVSAIQNINNTSLSLITEPDDGIRPIISHINTATSSIDLVIYEISDPEIENALITAENRGVSVRVMINQKTWNGKEMTENKSNASAFQYLNSHGIQTEWTPNYFALTHQKTFIFDKNTAIIMTFNLVRKYYKTGRDFGVIDSEKNDVAKVEQAFENDWQGVKNNMNSPSSDLVWSPGSRAALLSVIASAKKALLVYNEEMADADIEQALKDASARGVKVFVAMTDSPNWHEAFNSLSAGGVTIHTFAANDKRIYIHAKMIVADDQEAFLGSENFSSASLKKNRELGIVFTDSTIIKKLQSTFAYDWTLGKPYSEQ